jgi:hypothetical protein
MMECARQGHQQECQQPDEQTELAALTMFILGHGGTLRFDDFRSKILYYLGFICSDVANLLKTEGEDVKRDLGSALKFFSRDAAEKYGALLVKIGDCFTQAREAEKKGFTANTALTGDFLEVARKVREMCSELEPLIQWKDREAGGANPKVTRVLNQARNDLQESFRDDRIHDILECCDLIERVLTSPLHTTIPCLRTWCLEQDFWHKSTRHDPTSPKQKVSFENQIPNDICVKCDPVVLKVVIARLLSNASQHLPSADAQIQLLASLKEDGMVVLEVKNPVNPKTVSIPEIKLKPDRGNPAHGVALPWVKAVMRNLFGGDLTVTLQAGEAVARLTLPKPSGLAL